MHLIYLRHKFKNLSWITEINELFHDILIYRDAPVCVWKVGIVGSAENVVKVPKANEHLGSSLTSREATFTPGPKYPLCPYNDKPHVALSFEVCMA